MDIVSYRMYFFLDLFPHGAFCFKSGFFISYISYNWESKY